MTLNIAAAPMGARVGLSTARFGGAQVAIAVAPKAWRSQGPKHLKVDASSWAGHAAVSLYETERLSVVNAPVDAEHALWRALGVSRRDDDGALSWDSSMLVPDIEPRSSASLLELPVRDLQTDTADVLRLFECVQLLHGESDPVRGAYRHSPLHRPLLLRRFLDEVTSRVNTVRPGYRQVVERRTTIRGRIEPASLALFRSGASTTISCQFSQLTLSTQLLGCVAAALEWVADGRYGRSRLPGKFSDIALRHDAVLLRRALSEVTALPFHEAAFVGRRLHLSSLDRPWGQALGMSVVVLGQRDPLPSDDARAEFEAVELSVPTEKLWERVVHQALQYAGFVDVQPQAKKLTSDPWLQNPVAVSRTAPDNVARTVNDVFIVDAKYKTPSAKEGPSRDDQYQICLLYTSDAADE